MVARTKDVDPTENGFRLYEYLNPEAIDALYEHARRRDDASWRLEFDVGDDSILVASNGFIRVNPGEEP